MAKYIFVTGGVVSSLGKGITAASLGMLLKRRGLNVVIQKFDPYLNIDPGTLSPYQHGEVFVTEDGYEADLDLGHYERFININLSKESNITTGKIYESVLKKERKGDYLGKTVQVIPHVTDEIKSHIYDKSNYDVVITEIGGTVGDIESLPFLEAIRQVKKEVGKNDVLYIHVTLLPYISGAGEIKTKPTQHSVKELRSIGIQPDIIVCRTDNNISQEMKEKIAMFCDVDKDAIIKNVTAKSIYEVPILFQKENFDNIVLNKLELSAVPANLEDLELYVYHELHSSSDIRIAIVGKYVNLQDAYISIAEALKHACTHYEKRLNITYVSSELLEDDKMNIHNIFNGMDGILIPGGFGDRGIEGKIKAIQYARENNIPCFGICLGLQCMAIEFARNVLNLNDANSLEFDENCENPVIHLMESQNDVKEKGGTQRLGSYPCKLKNSKVKDLYKKDLISERHRHRFEFNNKYLNDFENNGFKAIGIYEKENLVEILEMDNNNYFVGCQFHPEFKSRPNNPHPLFLGFIKACMEKNDERYSSSRQ